MQWLIKSWYQPSPLRWCLAPLSGLFRLVASLRRLAYQRGFFKSQRLPVPVIIIGNINVGGSGKTPLVLWLAQQLQQRGWRPGIISRGYGGNAAHYPLTVTANTPVGESGDEPKLLALRSQCPVVVAPDRVAAGRQLLAQFDCNVIISDDGLQHYRLARDLELVVVDGRRGFGNGFCLPAGPLREPVSRLDKVDFVIGHDDSRQPWTMQLQLKESVNLTDQRRQPLTDWQKQTVHAVAGIGDPQRFFDQLRIAGLNVIEHAFADHHIFSAADLQFNDTLPLLMTEKDAVKCQGLVTANCWSVPADALLTDGLADTIDNRLKEQ
ncbi:MAG: tetraacyldisaccharide 4'-kinase [Methylophaga sp.]|nr:tetraacyldisaccharide 4'-kinase [Methylophaga sp.]